jgi:hypothetical protein
MTIQQALIAPPVPILVASVLGSTVSAGGVTSINIPATAAGDLIVAFGSNRTTTPTPTPAGWISVATGVCNIVGTVNDRSTRMVYQFTDGSAQTLTFDGAGSGASSVDPYSGCLIFRGASEVDTGAGVSNNSTGTTLAIPSLTIDRVPATVVAFSFYGDSITVAPAGWAISNGMAYAEYLTTWAGGNFTLSDTAALIGTTVPIY